jgi:hypothetical protein
MRATDWIVTGRIRSGVSVCFLLAGLFVSSGARAQVVSTYLGSGCQLDGGSAGSFTTSAGVLTAGPSGAQVSCPIAKKTSGPAVTSFDDIEAVELSIDNGSDPAAETGCDLVIYDAMFNSPSGSPSNVHEDVGSFAAGPFLTVLGLEESTTVNYWNPTAGHWFVPVLHCVLTKGVKINQYVVTEHGTDQGARIFAAANCAKGPMTGGMLLFPNGTNFDPATGGVVGYAEAVSPAGTFALNCPLPSGGAKTVNVSAAPSIAANNDLICAGVHVTTSGNPMQEFQTFSQEVTASGSFSCTMTTTSGDGKFVSYRVEPPRIDCGSTSAQSPFVADMDSTGGQTINHANMINLNGMINPAPKAVYQTARTGNFTYTVPGFTSGDNHKLRLHFAETYFSAPNKRTFNVKINGTQVLTSFDIFQSAGGMNKAFIVEFTKPADVNGNYVVQFINVIDNSLLSGLEVQ